MLASHVKSCSTHVAKLKLKGPKNGVEHYVGSNPMPTGILYIMSTSFYYYNIVDLT